MPVKSPFYIVSDFISPKKCDEIVSKFTTTTPDADEDGNKKLMERFNEELETELFGYLQNLLPELEEYYDCKYVGTEKMRFQQLPENPKDPHIKPGCQNSVFLRKKWVKVHDVDLTCILWLTDYNDNVPVDPRFEAYGGKLEFPQYNFSLVPQRGTLVVYPAGPHFVTATTPVLVANVHQVRINISIRTKDDGIWLYQPVNFGYDSKKGVLESWFNDHI